MQEANAMHSALKLPNGWLNALGALGVIAAATGCGVAAHSSERSTRAHEH